MHTLSNFDFKGRFDTLESQVHSYLKELVQASEYKSKFKIYRWAIDLSDVVCTQYKELVFWGNALYFLNENGDHHALHAHCLGDLIQIIYSLNPSIHEKS